MSLLNRHRQKKEAPTLEQLNRKIENLAEKTATYRTTGRIAGNIAMVGVGLLVASFLVKLPVFIIGGTALAAGGMVARTLYLGAARKTEVQREKTEAQRSAQMQSAEKTQSPGMDNSARQDMNNAASKNDGAAPVTKERKKVFSRNNNF